MLIDSCGRKIDCLRISVIDRCNLRCVYCTPEEGVTLLPREEILRYEEMLAFSEVAVREGIETIRLTGGEPLIRRDIIGFIQRMAVIPGLKDLSITTNAVLLEEYAEDLYRVGVKRLNIGVDTFDPEVFKRITRGGDISRVRAGIKKAVEVGFSPIKLNVVLMKGVTEDLEPFVRLIHEYPLYVRFIEYMPVSNGLANDFYVPAATAREQLKCFGELAEAPAPLGFGPVRAYQTFPGALGAIGFISAMSEHFCGQCSRLRLTADGKLRLCLFSDEEVDIMPSLRPEPDAELIARLLREAVLKKPKAYSEVDRDEHGRTMGQIGG